MVATNPDYQQFFQEMKQIIKSMCGATYLRLRDLFSESLGFIKNLLKINVANQEESSMNNTIATRSVDGNGGGDEEDIA